MNNAQGTMAARSDRHRTRRSSPLRRRWPIAAVSSDHLSVARVGRRTALACSFVTVDGITNRRVAVSGVDEVTHDVYVADTGNQRVDEFTSAGLFVHAWGWGVVNGASESRNAPKRQAAVRVCAVRILGSSRALPSWRWTILPAVKEMSMLPTSCEGTGGHVVQKFTANGTLMRIVGQQRPGHRRG